MSRLDRLRHKLSEQGIEAFLISRPANCCYLSGFDGEGFLLLTRDRAYLFTDFRYAEQAREQAPSFDLVQVRGELSKWLPEWVSELGIRQLGLEGDDLSLNTYRKLAERILSLNPPPELVPTSGVVEALRAVKDEDEIEKLGRAASLAEAALRWAGEFLRPGMEERKVAWELEKFLRENGSEELPFEIIVASGPNSALPHARPTSRLLLEGEPVIIDLGTRVQGYCGDLTRTFFLGRPRGEFERIYRLVQEAQTVALEGIRSGMTGEEADGLARKVIEGAGYGEAFGHGLGHGVGLEVHEAPRLGPESKDVLEEGMVFTLEPGIYLEGRGGVRLEDMVVLRGGKVCKLVEVEERHDRHQRAS